MPTNANDVKMQTLQSVLEIMVEHVGILIDMPTAGFADIHMSSASRILVLYAHATPHRSRVNRRLAEATRSLPNVQVRDLYELYPDFHIDVAQEQALLAEADLIVFQHPIQWYGMPALLKEWVDVVFENGWAYGPGENALRGKHFWLSVTTGGGEEAYRETGYHGRPFSDFLPPFEQTALLCGMTWLPPLIFHGAQRANKAEIAAHVSYFTNRLASYPHWPEIAAPSTDLPQAAGKP